MDRPVSSAGHAVRVIVEEEIPHLCAVLARAFVDDPLCEFIFPSAGRRPRGLAVYFRLQIERDFRAFGSVYTTDERAGAAVWAPPGQPMATGLRGLLAVLPVGPYVLGNLRGTLRHLSRTEAAHPSAPHWYLATLGTDPSRQGQGVGSALLQPVLARCDDEGVPAYLESSKASNVPFYRRHGFDVRQELTGDGAPTVWTMWREPRPPGDRGGSG